MSIRLDPRRLTALKQLAGEVGMRPGELVLQWVEERLDLERRGGGQPAPARTAAAAQSAVTDLVARLDALAARVEALETAPAAETGTPATTAGADAPEAPGPKRRQRRTARGPENEDVGNGTGPATRERRGERVALHDEIAAIIVERGPSTAAEIAEAIASRGRYAAPRSAKPLDAATVNSRVSNPAYRARFRRQDGRIALADTDGG